MVAWRASPRPVTVAAAPVPNDLHLAIEADGRPATEPWERGVRVEFAYSVAEDRPVARGVATRLVTRRSLLEDERGGRFIVQVDVAEGHGDGVPITEQQPRRPGLLPFAPSGVRVTTGSGATSSAGWRSRIRPGCSSRHLRAVRAAPSSSTRTRTDGGAGRSKPSGDVRAPEIAVVDSLDAVPRVWRTAARHLLGSPPR